MFLWRKMGKFYAVQRGRKTGVFRTWSECEKHVKGFPRARFKSFLTRTEAEQFVGDVGAFLKGTPQVKRKCAENEVQGTVKKFRCATPLSSTYMSSTSAKSTCNGEEFNSERPVVFTDGCCTKNGRHGARAGLGVFWGAENPWNVCERLEGIQTNQRAEIMAAVRALESAIAQNHKAIEVRTDSKYTIMGVTEWMTRWERNNFKTVNNTEVKNKEEFQRLRLLCQKIDVKWTHVPGHSGIPGNEAADSLAKKGAEHDQIEFVPCFDCRP